MSKRGPFPSIRFLLLVFVACVLSSFAQASDPRNVDASSFGQRITLGPEWLFSPGDNPAWASPAFDDSGWKAVSASHRLRNYGFSDIPYGWFRIHVHLRPGVHNVAVGVQGVSGPYEVYVNGNRVGGNGKMVNKVRFVQSDLAAWPVPDLLLTPKGELVLAIRFALSSWNGISGPLNDHSAIYLLSGDAATRDVSYVHAHNAAVPLALTSLSLLTGLIALALYGALRSHREYLAVAVYLLASSAFSATEVWQSFRGTTLSSDILRFLWIAIINVTLIEFVRLVLGQPHSRWLLTLEAAPFFSFFVRVLTVTVTGPNHFDFAAFFLPQLIVYILLPVMLVRSWRSGNHEARVLLPAVLIYGFAQYWNFLSYLAYFTHLTATLRPLPALHLGSFDATLYSVGYFVFYVTMLLFLVLRTVDVARRHAEVNAELEAARTVQSVLVPDEIPEVPGFAVESVYRPAGQVGGDFFQIMPMAEGGVLAAIGDVSGKGMPAAMTVSLLLGTLRTLVRYTHSPSEILAAMNQCMLTRSAGGFTTCLVLALGPDGKLTIANAGHVAPYLKGMELPLENGLPLGISAQSEYVESTAHVAENEQLTLITDGVIEARARNGDLFGFDRVAGIAAKPAEMIVNAAQSFGQEDDITVVTLKRISLPSRSVIRSASAGTAAPAADAV